MTVDWTLKQEQRPAIFDNPVDIFQFHFPHHLPISIPDIQQIGHPPAQIFCWRVPHLPDKTSAAFPTQIPTTLGSSPSNH